MPWDLSAIGLAAPAAALERSVRTSDGEHADCHRTTPDDVIGALGVARIHHDPAADVTARAFAADAVTVGTRVQFRRDAWFQVPSSRDALITHEMAHVAHSLRTGMCRPFNRIAGDPLRMAFTGADAQSLSETELERLILDLHDHLKSHSNPAAQHNLTLLESEASARQEESRVGDAPTPGPVSIVPPVDPSEAVRQDVLRLAEIVREYQRRVSDAPQRTTLAEVREVTSALERAGRELRRRTTTDAANATAAQAARHVEGLLEEFRPTQTAMSHYHAANSPDRSLGMWNEDTGTWLAGVALADYERNGVLYKARGSAAMTGAFLVAVLDLGESLLSFGFHEAATEISRAYHAGYLSVEEGNRLVWSAVWRSLLSAAVAAAIGRVATRLATVGLLRAGVVVSRPWAVRGAVAGMASSAVTTGFTDVFTRALASYFTSSQGQSVWNSGRPSEPNWAISISIGALFGGLGAARMSSAARQALVGSRHASPWGEIEVVAVTADGSVVLQPVRATTSPPRAPTMSTVDLVFDPETGTWRVPRAPVATMGPADPPESASRAAAVLPGPSTGPALPPGPSVPRLAAPFPAAPPVPVPLGQLPAGEVTPAVPPPDPVAAGGSLGPLITPPPKPAMVPFVSRLSNAEQALQTAQTATLSARAALVRARESLSLTEQWIAQEGSTAEARQLRDLEWQAVRDLTGAVRDLKRSEATAILDVVRARAAVDRVVPIINRLAIATRDYHAQMRARGFIRAPMNSALGRLELEIDGLRDAVGTEQTALTAWAGEVAGYAPGAAGQPLALANVRRMGSPLWDGSAPIDVTTAQPLASGWTVDHIVPRARIASDPRFWRLAPAQRRMIMLEVEANYLPMSGAANSSKGDQSVSIWAERLRSQGRSLRPDILEALVEAELRAAEAIEQAFNSLLGTGH